MVGQQDFEPAEWQLLCQAPTYAGLVVAGAQRGGFFWEALSIARTFSEVRAHHGQSRLLDDICAERPLVEQTRFRSPEQLRRHGLDHIRAAVDLLAQKGEPADVDAYAYARFLVEIADDVARAYPETDDPVSAAALGRIRPGYTERRSTLDDEPPSTTLHADVAPKRAAGSATGNNTEASTR